METLPLEMVEKVAEYLVPQDLTRLCAVSCRWREIFNQDRLWKHYCDPTLEQPLRTTPSVVEPKFVSPENEDSTLTSISQWRLAFMREKQLWKNWKLKNFKKESIKKLKDEFQVDFLSDTFIVRWCSNRIEIWDVSVIPASLVAKTDFLLDLGGCLHCRVVGNSVLIAKKFTDALVFDVDILNKRIELRNNMFLGEAKGVLLNNDNRIEGELHSSRIRSKTLETCVKGNILLHVDNRGLNLDIFDLEIGKKVKAEPCPEVEDGNVKVCICATKSSDTSDGFVVIVGLHIPRCSDSLIYHYYIYSIKDLRFLPGPIVKSKSRYLSSCAIHRHYFAIGGEKTSLKIFNYVTSEVLFEQYFSYITNARVFNDNFIFLDLDLQWGHGWLKMFDLAKKTLTTIIHHERLKPSLKMINGKFVVLFDMISGTIISVWEPSGQSLKTSDVSDPFLDKINQVFTRGIDNMSLSNSSTINTYHYW